VKHEELMAAGLSRRAFLGAGAALASAISLLDPRQALAEHTARATDYGRFGPLTNERLAGSSIADLQAMLQAGELTSVQLVRLYQERIQLIDRGLRLNSVLELNPDAEDIARALDRERAERGARGPLHGIPILVKDNIDTGDAMMTTAGSLALVGEPAAQDATVVARLRAAGAVILGKTNLSEWANFRGTASSSGWSAVGGQTANPYILDRNPAGSSSGSAAAVSAALCAAALGTETDGSVVCPSGACGVVGIKPTVGLTSRAGVVPVASSFDSVGVHGRTVADAAALLGALTGVDPRDAATATAADRSHTDYLQFVDPEGLSGARLGLPRQLAISTYETDLIFGNAIGFLRSAGAEIVVVDLPSFEALRNDNAELAVLIYEFKRDLNAYLATRTGVQVSSIAGLYSFNITAPAELRYFGQEFVKYAHYDFIRQDEYLAALERGRRLAADEGIDAVLRAEGLDALIAPTNTPAWPTNLITGDAFLYSSSSYAALSGYPLVTVPMGDSFGLPVGLTFMGAAWSEPTLIRLASGFEARTRQRRAPRFLPSFADGTRAEAEVFRRNPVRLPIPQLPTPPIEPVRVAWSGGGGSGRQSLMESSLRKILDDTPELA